ncbi:MAG: hypothetical protein IJ125_01920 [Atopobiaceae bacterium]|nr:hypothetical protein [Atopobiaceae bacterium]
MLRRKAYDRMLEWKRESNGSTALLVEGAKRVGKSTLVEEFGRREYRSCLVVDLFQAPAEVRQYFEDNRNDFDTRHGATGKEPCRHVGDTARVIAL